LKSSLAAIEKNFLFLSLEMDSLLLEILVLLQYKAHVTSALNLNRIRLG